MVEVLRSHTDMEVAHAELIARLQRIRPLEPRGVLSQSAPTPPVGVPSAPPPSAPSSSSSSSGRRSRWSIHTQRTMSVSSLESLPRRAGARVQQGPASPRARRVRPRRAHGRLHPHSGVCGGELAEVPLRLSRVRFSRIRAAPRCGAVRGCGLRPCASSHSPSCASPRLYDGDDHRPPAARHHRVWINGEVAVWATGTSLSVPCGPHVVRIGSGGASQSVDVPCGGRVALVAGDMAGGAKTK